FESCFRRLTLRPMRQFLTRAGDILSRPRLIFWVYVIAAAAVAVQRYVQPVKHGWTGYNNFLIFRESFFHLIKGWNLYVPYPDAHQDVFKYSPTFALFMAPWSVLPDLPGVVLWNVFNTWMVFFALRRLRGLAYRHKVVILWMVLIEALTSAFQTQTNGMIAGLMIMCYNAAESGRFRRAAFWAVAAGFIKIFGAIVGLLLLLYPQRLKALTWGAFWAVVLLFLPLLVVSPADLAAQYAGWQKIIGIDYASKGYISLIGMTEMWAGRSLSPDGRLIVQCAALAVLVLPALLRYGLWQRRAFRLTYLAAILMWVILFNHRSESPTYVVAVCGACVAYFSLPRRTRLLTALMALMMILTVLSPTDVFPRALREAYVYPYGLKALPVALIWIYCMVELCVATFPSETQSLELQAVGSSEFDIELPPRIGR
ncbi:MAG: glycosyltransferase family 87 protein, partial [Bacteroidia bacterium]|nr:glycosyltransferase family 87 protein [Bacteroidia bacterium]